MKVCEECNGNLVATEVWYACEECDTLYSPQAYENLPEPPPDLLNATHYEANGLANAIRAMEPLDVRGDPNVPPGQFWTANVQVEGEALTEDAFRRAARQLFTDRRHPHD